MGPNRYVVIMAGGRGERFWPQSRQSRPKHLLPVVGDRPLLTQAVERLGGLVPPERVLVITNAEQREAVREVCPMLPPANVIAEPVGRDTAAAVALAAILVGRRDPRAAFAMLPADPVVDDPAAYQSVLDAAFTVAEEEDALVTVGVKAAYPATGYGYIERGALRRTVNGHPVRAVTAFREKPSRESAEAYVRSGAYYWNAGMFIWRVPVLAAALAEHAPDVWDALAPVRDGLAAGRPLADLLARHYPGIRRISIDFALMEKARAVRVVEAAFRWDDVGEWPAIARHYPADDRGNVVKGAALVHDGSGNIVVNDGRHLTALLGVDDLIVVHTDDATLVCRKDRAQDIKQLLGRLAGEERFRHLL